MAFKQYTKCTPSQDFDPLNRPLAIVGGLGGLAALIASVFITAAIPVLGIIFVLGGALLVVVTIVNVFEYLLGGKLICLGGDKLAIGQVLSVEPASSKSGYEAMDNDLSVNLLLCPHQKKVDDPSRSYIATDLPDIDPSNIINFQDFLVQEHPASSIHGVPYSGYETTEFKSKPVFHIELEGSRIYDTYRAFLAAWFILYAAALAAMAVASIPVIGWLIALLIMLLGVGIGAAIVGITWGGADDGNTSDIDPTIGELHKGEVLIAYGTWTYDSGHNDDNVGWNELHPVKFLSKTDKCVDSKGAQEWEDKIKETFDPEVIKSQSQPQNQWEYHPEIGGCSPTNHEELNIK